METTEYEYGIDDVEADIVTGQALKRHLPLHLILKNKKLIQVCFVDI